MIFIQMSQPVNFVVPLFQKKVVPYQKSGTFSRNSYLYLVSRIITQFSTSFIQIAVPLFRKKWYRKVVPSTAFQKLKMVPIFYALIIA